MYGYFEMFDKTYYINIPAVGCINVIVQKNAMLNKFFDHLSYEKKKTQIF